METFAFTFLRLVDFGPDISSHTKEICKFNVLEDRKDIPEARKVFRHAKVSGRGRKKSLFCTSSYGTVNTSGCNLHKWLSLF